MASAKEIFQAMSGKLLQSFRMELRHLQQSNYWGGVYLYFRIVKPTQSSEAPFLVQIHDYSAPIPQIRDLGMITGTEFTNNKSPTDLFPAEWGK